MKGRIKAILFMSLAAAMFIMTSCERNDVKNEVVETKSFFIQIGKSDVATRAEGDNISSTTVTFTDGYLIFTAGGEINHVIDIIATAVEDEDITVTKLKNGVEIAEIPANTTNVYLYGNVENASVDFSTVAVKGGNIADVDALTWLLADIQDANNTVASVPIFGKGDVAPGEDNPDRLESKFPVRPIGARLQIGEIKCTDTNVEELMLSGIYINGFYKKMDANNTFKDAYFVDKGINVSEYSASGYSDYATMADIFSTSVDVKAAAVTPSQKSHWAYNFFPAEMPHIVLHFTSIKAGGNEITENRYVTVAKYSTSATGEAGKEYLNALAGRIYTLNINITNCETQLEDLPESNSSVSGHIEIEVIDWESIDLYPEW